MKYVALLRGINVGGNNIIKMVDLRKAFEDLGAGDVETYIQSGNVVFSSKVKDTQKLMQKVEAGLSDAFDYASRVVIVSADEVERVMTEAPKAFGKQATLYRYDVLFVRPPVTPKDVLSQITLKKGVDSATAGTHAVYFQRLVAKATQSHLSKIVQQPVYKDITIRNWRTTTKLHAMVAT